MHGLATSTLRRLERLDLLETRAYVAGAWLAREHTSLVTDPATGDVIACIASCSVETIDLAVRSAEAAFPAWRGLLPVERGAVLRTWAALVRTHAEDLAVIITAEQGKPLAESRGEVAYGAAFLDWFASEGERAYGETMPSHLPGSRTLVQMQPIGVTAAITP